MDDDIVDDDIDDDNSSSRSLDEEPQILAQESQTEDLLSDENRNSEEDCTVLVEETNLDAPTHSYSPRKELPKSDLLFEVKDQLE